MQIFEEKSKVITDLQENQENLGKRSEKSAGRLLERLTTLADPDIKVGVIMADRINKIRLAKKGQSKGFVGGSIVSHFFLSSLHSTRSKIVNKNRKSEPAGNFRYILKPHAF